MTMTTTAQAPTPEPILQLATGFMAAKQLFVANEIGLFGHLREGPLSLDELAQRAAVPKRTTRIVADAMLALGLLEHNGGRYQNGPVAGTFLSGSGAVDLRPLLRFWNHISYPAWLKLEQAVRSGEAQPHDGHFSEEEQRIFSAGVEALTAGTAQALAGSYDFSSHRRALDLGGGTGSFLIAALTHHPGLNGTLLELPSVTPVAERRISTEPCAGRVQLVAGDFFTDPIPSDHDVVIVANVAHLFSPARNIELLRRTRAAVADGARLLFVDFWTDPTHTQPAAATLLAGEFLVIAGEGDVYSEAEVRGWLREAGWRFVEHSPLDGAASLIVAETAG